METQRREEEQDAGELVLSEILLQKRSAPATAGCRVCGCRHFVNDADGRHCRYCGASAAGGLPPAISANHEDPA